MKKVFAILLLMLNDVSYGQVCDCDIYPIAKKCRRDCGLYLLKNGTPELLKKEIKLNDETIKLITNIPDRRSKNTLNDFKNSLPTSNYKDLTIKLNNYYQSINVNNGTIQKNVNGTNIGNDQINYQTYIVGDTTHINNVQYHTTRIENTNFIYNTEKWKFNVDSSGEDIMTPINPYDLRYGLVTEYPFKCTNPRIPSGSMIINFTIENHGNMLAVIDNFNLEIVNSYDIPQSARINFYKPILEPEQDHVYIKPNKTFYTIFSSKRYKYAPNELDEFRLRVILGKENASKIYEYKIHVDYRIGNQKYQVNSDRSYFIASNVEVTEQQKDDWGKELTGSLELAVPRFYDINTKIQEDSLLKARELLDERIEKLKKMPSLRLNYSDSGPKLNDCVIFRIILCTYLGDKRTAESDLSFLRENTDFDNYKKIQEASRELRKIIVNNPDEALETIKKFSFENRGQKNSMIFSTKIYDMDINYKK